MYKEIKGDLIELAKNGNFDVITHGCNCLCVMKAGIAPQIAKAFGADKFDMEQYTGIEKLGNIDYQTLVLGENTIWNLFDADNKLNDPELIVVNSYTQHSYGKNHKDGVNKPLDYQALQLCLRKINYVFKGKKIGLPKIGCGLAGGDWSTVKEVIKKELKDCYVTVVIYNK